MKEKKSVEYLKNDSKVKENFGIDVAGDLRKNWERNCLERVEHTYTWD